jgi:hypothetical protein
MGMHSVFCATTATFWGARESESRKDKHRLDDGPEGLTRFNRFRLLTMRERNARRAEWEITKTEAAEIVPDYPRYAAEQTG